MGVGVGRPGCWQAARRRHSREPGCPPDDGWRLRPLPSLDCSSGAHGMRPPRTGAGQRQLARAGTPTTRLASSRLPWSEKMQPLRQLTAVKRAQSKASIRGHRARQVKARQACSSAALRGGGAPTMPRPLWPHRLWDHRLRQPGELQGTCMAGTCRQHSGRATSRNSWGGGAAPDLLHMMAWELATPNVGWAAICWSSPTPGIGGDELAPQGLGPVHAITAPVYADDPPTHTCAPAAATPPPPPVYGSFSPVVW